MKTSMSSMALVLAIATVLSGCGASGPSEADVHAAMERWGREAGGEQLEKMMKSDYAQVKVVACAKADANGWQCDLSNPSMSARFVKSASGWIFISK